MGWVPHSCPQPGRTAWITWCRALELLRISHPSISLAAKGPNSKTGVMVWRGGMTNQGRQRYVDLDPLEKATLNHSCSCVLPVSFWYPLPLSGGWPGCWTIPIAVACGAWNCASSLKLAACIPFPAPSQSKPRFQPHPHQQNQKDNFGKGMFFSWVHKCISFVRQALRWM